MEEKERKSVGSKLRRLAEKALESAPDGRDTFSGMCRGDMADLIHELRVHQIELKMQNEELRRVHGELEKTRDRYSHLYDFAPVGYLTLSEKGLVTEANLKAAKLLGIERSLIVGSLFSRFILNSDQDIFYLHRIHLMESGTPQTLRLRLVRKDGSNFYAHLECMLVEPEAGGPKQIRTVVSDITEQENLENQLRHAQKLEAIGTLAGGIAHDFNNLLMVILGNADLALEELSTMSPARGNLQEIEKACRRAAELAKQMLAYSGKGRFVVEPIDAGTLVKEMAHLLEVSISKSVVLKYNFTPNLPIFEGDVTQICQIIMNLITNASEAIGDKSGFIALSTGAMTCDRAYLDDVDAVLRASLERPLPEGAYAYFEVTDTGCGMNTNTMEKIFDPFFTTKFTGRGLGMSAVLGIVRGHKGALKIHSEVGKGTTFKILFPVNEPSDIGSTYRGKDETGRKNWRGSGTVLIADDEETVLAVGKQMIERLGFSALTAADGREAVEVYREHAEVIVCVLLDLTMPHMDGEKAFCEMRRTHPDVTVILCSGYNEHDATQRFTDNGLAGFIQKPFKMDALREKLMEVLVTGEGEHGISGHA